jgi:enoyl-CoA hydratase/carnithine racemase
VNEQSGSAVRSGRPETVAAGLANEPSAAAGHERRGGAAPNDPVGRELDGAVAVLTMQLAPHNLLGQLLVDELLASLAWAQSQGARAVLLRSGLRHFCAGADLDAFGAAVARGEVSDFGFVKLLRAFDALPIPIVASVHGVCVGGGFELALASDLVVVSESAKLGCVESTLGLHPLMGAVQRITQRAGATRAKEMALLGRRYDPRTLERWGLINRVVADEQLEAVTHTLAQELAHGPTVAHAATKALVSVTVDRGVAAADDAMAQLQLPIWSSEDLKAGLASFAQEGAGMARFEGR